MSKKKKTRNINLQKKNLFKNVESIFIWVRENGVGRKQFFFVICETSCEFVHLVCDELVDSEPEVVAERVVALEVGSLGWSWGWIWSWLDEIFNMLWLLFCNIFRILLVWFERRFTCVNVYGHVDVDFLCCKFTIAKGGSKNNGGHKAEGKKKGFHLLLRWDLLKIEQNQGWLRLIDLVFFGLL